MKKYKVVTKQGSSITTVYADNEEQARLEAYRVLDRPGRREVLRRWIEDGERLVEKC